MRETGLMIEIGTETESGMVEEVGMTEGDRKEGMIMSGMEEMEVEIGTVHEIEAGHVPPLGTGALLRLYLPYQSFILEEKRIEMR